MNVTANYGLYITEPQDDPKFREFREKLCGNNESNMVLIDRLLAEKAEVSVVNATLLASDWDGTQAPYIQTLQIDGVTPQADGVVTVSPDISDSVWEVVCNAGLRKTVQDNASATFCANSKPEVDIPIVFLIFR